MDRKKGKEKEMFWSISNAKYYVGHFTYDCGNDPWNSISEIYYVAGSIYLPTYLSIYHLLIISLPVYPPIPSIHWGWYPNHLIV